MRNQFHTSLLIVFISSVFLSNCSSPRETINNKFVAISQAKGYINTTRLKFTQGQPKVIFAKEMTLDEAKELTPKDWINNSYPYTSKNMEIWLVIFKGSWQVYPPYGDLQPLESGCIYTIIEKSNRSQMSAMSTKCQELP